jgi:hypothetical protein
MNSEDPIDKLIARFLHLFLIVNLAIGHPVLQSASSHAEFLVAHNVTRFDLIVLVGMLSLVLPALLSLLEWPAPRPLHFVFVTILTFLLLLPVLKTIPDSSGVIPVALAILLSIGLTWLTFRSSAVFQTIKFVSAFALVVPFLFFWNPSVRSVLAEPEPPKAPILSAKIPIVMILFDELPLTSLLDDQGNIDEVRYPNFAQLSKESTWLKNTTTCSSLTEISVPALLSSTYPYEGRLPVIKDYPNNLFTLLGGSYEMHINETVTRLWPEKGYKTERLTLLLKDAAAVYLHATLPQRFTENLPSVTEKWANFWSESDLDRRKIFQNFIDSIQPAGAKPPFYFLHVMLPHKPWIYLPSGKEYRDYGSLLWGTLPQNHGVWLDDPLVVQNYWKRHLLQVGFIDRMIGQLVQKLKSTGLYESSLLIVTSDHGVGFSPNESLRKSVVKTTQDILYVPLFVRLPHQEKGTIIARRMETVDILPTIAGALEIRIPWKVSGFSALDPREPEHRRRTRIKGGEHFQHFQSDLSLDDASFQKRLAALGARNSFSTFFTLPSSFPKSADHNQYSIQLTNPQAFENVNLSSNYIPCFIPGTIQTSEEKLTLMIRINGEPRAITQTFPQRKGELRFAALVPESSFRQGKNEVEVIVLK